MADQPWQDRQRLANVLAGWRLDWSGRALHTVTAGSDWVRLHLVGEERCGFLLTDVPAAQLAMTVFGRLDEPLRQALTPARGHPLTGLLDGARLLGVGLLPEDRVACFALERAGGEPVTLLHRLFGSRGDTVLLTADGRVLWSRRRPPHSSVLGRPPKATWTGGTTDADELSAPALEHLTAVLAARRTATAAGHLERQRRRAERLVENLAADLAKTGKGDDLRRRAEALAAALHTVERGAAEARVTDLRDGSPLVVPLDPALTPAANLDAWFHRARKSDRGRELVVARLAEAREKLAAVDAARADLDAADAPTPLARLAAVQDWWERHADLLPAPAPARGRHAAEQPARPFRRYLVEDRWEVWVGRNNQENDELTHRASHLRDLWFHAQGVSGSHVILRTDGQPEQVPRRVLEMAAALAALHSKARNSALVPVIWTERRYVRRPRKAPAGTAVCLREESLFAAPGVPAGVTTI